MFDCLCYHGQQRPILLPPCLIRTRIALRLRTGPPSKPGILRSRCRQRVVRRISFAGRPRQSGKPTRRKTRRQRQRDRKDYASSSRVRLVRVSSQIQMRHHACHGARQRWRRTSLRRHFLQHKQQARALSHQRLKAPKSSPASGLLSTHRICRHQRYQIIRLRALLRRDTPLHLEYGAEDQLRLQCLHAPRESCTHPRSGPV